MRDHADGGLGVLRTLSYFGDLVELVEERRESALGRFDPRSRAQGKTIGWRDGVRALQVLIAERLR